MYFLTKFSASISRLQWGSNWAHIYQHFFRSTKRLRERFKGWPLHYTQPPNGVLKLLIQLSLLFLFSVLIPSIFVLCFVYIEFSLWSLLKLSFWLLLKLAKAYANFSSSPSHKYPPVQHLSFCQPVAARLTQFSFHFFLAFFTLRFTPSPPLMQIQICMWHLRGKWKETSKSGTKCPPFSGIELLSDSSLEKCDSLSVSLYSIDIQS